MLELDGETEEPARIMSMDEVRAQPSFWESVEAMQTRLAQLDQWEAEKGRK